MIDFLIHDAVRVEYRVVAQPLGSDLSRIENEHRAPGGNGALTALMLAKWGAKVRLVGNALVDDTHGRFLRQFLGDVPNLEYQPQMRADSATPYAILLRQSDGAIQTLLSLAATQITLAPLAPDETARHILSLVDDTGGDSSGAPLAPQTQNYAALLISLERAAKS